MADAQYIIDVSAQMTGDETLAELDSLSAKLVGGGKDAQAFQAAMQGVSRELETAKAASKAANAALGEGSTVYAQLERAALQASKAAERAGQKNKGVVPAELVAAAAQANAAVQSYAGTLRTLEKNAATATAKEDALAKSLKNVNTLAGATNKAIAAQGEKLEKLRGALSASGGQAGAFASSLLAPVQGFTKLSASMGSANAAMVVGAAATAALVLGVVLLAAAAVAATIAVAAWAVGLADSARSAALSREALEAVNPELVALRGNIDAIAGETGLATAEISGLAKSLADAKVSAEDMPDALRAAALAERALGKGGSAKFLADIKAGKVAVADLAAASTSKLGGIVAQQMRGLDAQALKFKANVSGIFGGLNIEPVLAGLEILVGLFDKSTAAGQAIKFLFEELFQPLIDQAKTAAIVLEAFALGFVIGLLKMYIAAKPTIKAISEFFSFEDTSLEDVLNAVAVAAEYLAPVAAVLAAIVGGALVVAFAAGAAALALFYAPVALAIAAFGALVAGVSAAWDFLKGLDFAAIGTAIIQGLVNGITGGASAVLSAITGAVQGAIDGAKRLLGIASPSKVFAEIGVNTSEGFAGGVEDGAPEAQSAMAQMVSPASSASAAGAAPASGAATAPAGGSALDILKGAIFNFYGVEGAEDAEARFGELLTRVLEGDAAALGAHVQGAT